MGMVLRALALLRQGLRGGEEEQPHFHEDMRALRAKDGDSGVHFSYRLHQAYYDKA